MQVCAGRNKIHWSLSAAVHTSVHLNKYLYLRLRCIHSRELTNNDSTTVVTLSWPSPPTAPECTRYDDQIMLTLALFMGGLLATYESSWLHYYTAIRLSPNTDVGGILQFLFNSFTCSVHG